MECQYDMFEKESENVALRRELDETKREFRRITRALFAKVTELGYHVLALHEALEETSGAEEETSKIVTPKEWVV